MKREFILLLLVASALASISTVAATSNGPEWVADMLYYYSYPATYPSQIQPGDQGVWVDVAMRNYYTMNYYNVSTELLVTGPFEGVVTKAEVANVKPGETAHVFYQLNVRDDAKPGEYKMRQKMTYYYDYYDEDGVKTVVRVDSSKTISVNVYYSERVEIENITVTPKEVHPGEGFNLAVGMRNTGSVTVNDIDVSYAVATDPSTVNLMTIGSSTKHVQTIRPNESAVVTFPLEAIKAAAVKGYKVNVTASYTSGTATATERDSVGVDVIGRPKVRLAGVQADRDTIYAGKPFSLSVQLENIGTGDAKSVKAELEDTAVNGVTTSYVGTVDVDDTGSAIFDISDGTPGRKTATVLVSYEDNYGNTFDERVNVEYFVTAVPKSYDWAVAAVAVLLIGGYLYRRHRTRKKEMAMVK